MDQKDWVRVIDHTHYFCRSWQYLYFEPRVVRYIRIVGTNNTVNKVFHVVSFEAMFTHNNVELQNGLIGKLMLSVFLLSCFSLIVKPQRASHDCNMCIEGSVYVLCKSRQPGLCFSTWFCWYCG